MTSDPLPLRLLDAATQIFGPSATQPLQKLWNECNDLRDFEQKLLYGFVYGLPTVAGSIPYYKRVDVPPELQDESFWNIFRANAHACGIAATLVHVYERLKASPPGARHLAERTVAEYLSFADHFSHNAAELLPDLIRTLDETKRQREDRQKKGFKALVDRATTSLNNKSEELTDGIQFLIEAFLVVREKREETVPLTIDLKVPLSASWFVFQHASRGESENLLKAAEIPTHQTILKALGKNYSLEDVVKELEDAGRYVGRGVALLELRSQEGGPKSGLFSVKKIWPSHADAPLSKLYNLGWPDPSLALDPDVRFILLHGSTISIQLQDDPLFEYFLGNWTYVDLKGKSELIANLVGESVSDPNLDSQRLRRLLHPVGRFAYQLAYHNHGGTVELFLQSKAAKRDKLEKIQKRWGIEAIKADGLALMNNDPKKPATNGRFAYVLSLQDGLTRWTANDEDELKLHDFGVYVPLSDSEFAKHWPSRAAAMGLEKDRKVGARHKSAFLQSVKAGKRKLVYCVSQDGFIEVYREGFFLRLR